MIGQTYPNIEIIVFDDCSSDQSFDIIQEYKEILENRFENVIIRQNEVNLGVTKTLNRMIQLSKGTYIKPIASDDMMISNAIEEMIFCLEHNKSHNILISNGIKISEESSYSNVIKKDIIYESNPNFSGDDFMFRIALNNILFAPGAIYKKEIFDLYGLFDEEIAVEDFEFWLRMIKNKEKIVFCSENN